MPALSKKTWYDIARILQNGQYETSVLKDYAGETIIDNENDDENGIDLNTNELCQYDYEIDEVPDFFKADEDVVNSETKIKICNEDDDEKILYDHCTLDPLTGSVVDGNGNPITLEEIQIQN